MKDKPQGYAHLTAKIDSLQEQLHLCNVDQISTAAELAATIAQRDTLLVAFDKYGQHLRKCINTKDNSCDCGFISIYYAIRRMKEEGK